jgi:tetratricopeptide (TPR) repeat protein
VAGIALASVCLAACGSFGGAHKEAGPPPRYAVLGFENLSGDASLDWVSRGAPEYLARTLRDALVSDSPAASFVGSETLVRTGQRLGSHPGGAPGESTSRSAAVAAGVNRILSGYFERTSTGVRITASEEDVTTHRTVLTESAVAGSAFAALGELSHELSTKSESPATGNAEAFRIYCSALEGPAADATGLLEQAVALDPAFGQAWVVLAQTYAALGDKSRAEGVIEKALLQKLPPVDRARLDFEDASLRGDRTGVLASMRKVFSLSSSDIDFGRSLADAETAAGNFSQAAAIWSRATAATPEDTNAWNQLGYTRCWSGDYPGALAALREYARLRPKDANPFDSQGDVHYWFGKYADAAASYEAAYAIAPAFQLGGDLYKAAWSKYFAGDRAGAETLFGKFRSAREQAKDPSIILFTGDWLYRTGQSKEAIAQFREALARGGTLPPAVRAGIAAQLAVWDLLSGDRAAGARDVSSGGTTGVSAGDLLARFAAMPTASAAEWEVRAGQGIAAPGLNPAQLAMLRLTAVGYALILDGRKEAAIPVWEQIVKQSPGTDFLARTILTRLRGQPPGHMAPPDALNVTPFASILGTL